MALGTLALIGLIILVIGVVMAIAWRREPGIALTVVGFVIFLVGLFAGGGAEAAAGLH